MIQDAGLELVASRFPHLGKGLRLLWGHPEVVTYVDKLFLDTRGATRRGFPPDVMQALVEIRALHQTIARGESVAAQAATTPWGHGGRRGRW